MKSFLALVLRSGISTKGLAMECGGAGTRNAGEQTGLPSQDLSPAVLTAAHNTQLFHWWGIQSVRSALRIFSLIPRIERQAVSQASPSQCPGKRRVAAYGAEPRLGHLKEGVTAWRRMAPLKARKKFKNKNKATLGP